MKLLAIALAFVGGSALASTNGYDLKMDLSLNGKHVSSPRLIVRAGETAYISQKTDTEETFIEVVADEGSIQNHQGILMNFTVGIIDQNGQRVIKATPQILSKENEASQIRVGKSSSDEISLSVVATRKSI
jgi:hypothetical protein